MLSSSSIISYNLNKCRKIILNRPKAMNTLNIEMCNEIKRLLLNWNNDSSINVIIMKGEGDKAFCAGIFYYIKNYHVFFLSFVLFSSSFII